MKMNILQEILEQLKQINEKLSTVSIAHTYESIKPGHIYNSRITDRSEYQERFQAKMNL